MQESINSQSMLKVGTVLRGIYRIDSYLSSGGYGNTYIATNIEFDERVAIKEFFMKGVTQREGNQTTVSVSNSENTDSFLEQKEKFKKEARRIRQLKNEHIVAVHDLFEENGTAYYVMDYIDGENLAERLKLTGKPMTEKEVGEILPQILDALKVVHDAGIWHLDLKPANIMIDKTGKIKLIDFGASKQLNPNKGGATTSTAISYTNGYAPREQMEQNYDKFGPWTDIYALGATLYNLLTNKRPPLPTDIDDDISEDKHLALPMPNVSNKMKQLVLWQLKTNRMQRPQKINDIKLKALLPGLQQEPVLATLVQEEETIVAKKESGQDAKTICSHPTNTQSDYETDVPTESDSRNNTWTWIIVAICMLIGSIFIIGNCESNNLSKPVTDDIYEAVDTTIWADVEQMPSYPGGDNALMTYLSDNTKYPEEAEKKGIEGRVLIMFVVEKDGTLSNIGVAQSVNPLLDKESIRVVKSMKNWIPGKQNGKPVRVFYTIPFNFKLE